MPFDWMDSQVSGTRKGPKQQVHRAVLEQAGLLRRMGYDAKYATMRCLANVQWQYDGQPAPLSDTEIKKLVGSVYN
ncbi:MAG: hypothetical protein CMH52_00325 [Myxococcales bacterium]|nr:hypothetical protein [Myxococcales bacterium]|tara:strand:+ start:1316 stop:1543 length:228 start_codon:yes stop_codon:yes gene_type:complete